MLAGAPENRIREAFADISPLFEGPVEVDETYVGGKRRNMSNAKRRELAGTGRGPVGKTVVVGAKDRATNQVTARVVESPGKETLQGFVDQVSEDSATVYTDGSSAYKDRENHDFVRHSVGEYVRGPWSTRTESRVLLVDAQTRPQGCLPQAVGQAPATVRGGVRGSSQHPGAGHPRTDAARGRRNGRHAAHVPGADCRLSSSSRNTIAKTATISSGVDLPNSYIAFRTLGVRHSAGHICGKRRRPRNPFSRGRRA